MERVRTAVFKIGLGTMEPQTPNRREKRRQRTKDAIIAAAADTFARKGVANALVADITEAADVAYGTFYNHFDNLNEVISAVAQAAMARMANIAAGILADQEVSGLIPTVSIRVVMRLMSADPAIRWLLEKPYLFIEEWHKTMTPFILSFFKKDDASSSNVFAAVGGTDMWIKMTPWVLMCQLNDAIEKGSTAENEDAFANMVLQLIGLDETSRAAVVEASRKIVDSRLSKALRSKVNEKQAQGQAG